MKKIALGMAAAAAFNAALAQDMPEPEAMAMYVTHQALRNCPAQLDTGPYKNADLARVVRAMPPAQLYPIAMNGVTLCFNTQLQNTRLETGEPVSAAIALNERTIYLNPALADDAAAQRVLRDSARGLEEIIEQIQRRGGPVPAHVWYRPLGIALAPEEGGFPTMPAGDANVFKALRPAPGNGA